jgi:acetylglutamate kinase
MTEVNARHAPELTASVLTQALPYIQEFAGTTVVVKFGGNAMVDPNLFTTFARDIVLMHSVGIKPVVVHGGGPQIGALLNKVGKDTEFVDGLRVTDAETLDIVRMVLAGKVGRDIVSEINVHGPLAVGVSGEDAGLIRAEAYSEDHGYVGRVVDVNPDIIHKLQAEDLIPVISTIGSDAEGQAYNINADTVAGHLAAAVGANKLVMLTDVDGLRREPDDPDTLIRQTTSAELHPLVGTHTVSGGMIPKVEACLHAVDNGVASAHVLNGTVEHVLLLEIFTVAGIGTIIRGSND